MLDVLNELVELNARTNRKYGPFPDLPNGIFKLQEEYGELEKEARMKNVNYLKVKAEALDVANVALRIVALAQEKINTETAKWNLPKKLDAITEIVKNE